MKKTLQNELKSSSNEKIGTIVANNANVPKANGTTVGNIAAETDQLVNNNPKKASSVVMDDVNFKYLKHVILKFLTSREVSHIYLQFISNLITFKCNIFLGRSTTFDTSHWNSSTSKPRRRTITTRNAELQGWMVWIEIG